MTQDYIKRGKPKSKSNSRAKAKPTGRGKSNAKPAAAKQQPLSESGKPPYIAMTLMALTVGVFGYFLWSINGAANNQTPSSVVDHPQVTQAVKPSVTKAVDEPQIPPPPQEDWQYMDELKNKTVEVAVTEVENKGPYLMQCATFKDARRA
jgi:hypothetical protein